MDDNNNISTVNTAILLDVEGVAQLLTLSRSGVYKLYKSGALAPRRLKIGKLQRWSRPEIERWVAAGCPHRQKWETINRGVGA